MSCPSSSTRPSARAPRTTSCIRSRQRRNVLLPRPQGPRMAVMWFLATAIIGPSGCGKSTFIRCLNRMHEVVRGARAEGHVELNGQDIYASNVDPVRVRRVVGMVFQKPNPFPMMTIFENVVAGLRLEGGYAANRLEEIAERALRHAALWDEVK